MALNESIHYVDGALYVDLVPVAEIAAEVDTPVYVYSLKRVLQNFNALKSAFGGLDAHIHYSAKANAIPAILEVLFKAGAGVDAVSGGEINAALRAGVRPEEIVLAGVGKTLDEIHYAVEKGVGWINIENPAECDYINDAAEGLGKIQRVALRLNPDVTATTHPYIATGHGGAKFGMTADTVRSLLTDQDRSQHIDFAGIHVHIGSQLQDANGTRQAVERALALVNDYPEIRTINIGGGFPASYRIGEVLPSPHDFAANLGDLLKGYQVILEPGRSVVADAGILVSTVLYVKEQGGQCFYIVDASMSELIRPALYHAEHEIVPLQEQINEQKPVQIVGPVCETADVLGRDVTLPPLQPGDKMAVLTAGAYGSVMASNYNARRRPAEVAVNPDGTSWQIVRRRETFEDLARRDVYRQVN